MTRLTRQGGLAATRRGGGVCPVSNPSGAIEYTFETNKYATTNTANAPYELNFFTQGGSSGGSGSPRSTTKAYAGTYSVNAYVTGYGGIEFNTYHYVKTLPTQIDISVYVLNNSLNAQQVKVYAKSGNTTFKVSSAGTTPNNTTWTQVSLSITSSTDIADLFSKSPSLPDAIDKYCWGIRVGGETVYQNVNPVDMYFDNFFVTYTF